MNEDRRRIGIIVDHPQRDLPGAALLAQALAERGLEAALIPLYDQGIDVALLDLDALVLNFARDVNLPLVRTYAALGIALYVLDTEGGIMSSTGSASPGAVANYVAGSDFRDLLTGYFFWGERLRDAFLAADALDAEALHLTGCPRFDLYHPPYVDQTRPARTGHVLVNTNFPLVNPRFVAGRNDRGDRRAQESAGQSPEYIDSLYDSNKLVMDGMIALLRRLADDFPADLFVLRPHPFEDGVVYERELAGLENVRVEGAGPVIAALRGAKALIHCNCSTAIEAVMLGIPPLSPDWINTDFLVRHAPLPTQSSVRFDDYEALATAVRRNFASERDALDRLYRDVAFPWFYEDDGRAAQRVADILASQVTVQRRKARSLTMSLRSGRAEPSTQQRVQGIVANIVGSRLAATLRARLNPARRAKWFAPADVQELTARFADARGAAVPVVSRASHPLHQVPLSSVKVAPHQSHQADAQQHA